MRAFILFSSLAGFSLIGHAAELAQVDIGPYSADDALDHQSWIREAFKKNAGRRTVFRFAPGEYQLVSAKGFAIPEGATLLMEGATFVFSKDIQEDGEAFLIRSVSNINIKGGEIVGRRDFWDPGVNVAGIRIVGNVENVLVESLTCRELTANGVGVFGESDTKPIRNISLSRITTVNCCNSYGDYLSDKKGPAPNSERKDQGNVAFYYVDGWVVDGCRLIGSKSDGTHFYFSHNGQFTNNVVSNSKMGGYFIEECTSVLASGNIISGNGSRGVTIERNSLFCTLTNNIIKHSGREGLWAPEVRHILVNFNIFQENGRKDDKEQDCEIRLDNSEAYKTVTGDIHIKNNIFYASDHQTAFVLVDDAIEDVLMGGNTYTGSVPELIKRPARK